ncbi:MAG: metal-sensing transcriptional repressor [Clostridia bacterium]|nr:metal-sensing transcriptional repressor [Clostridia bacterium]
MQEEKKCCHCCGDENTSEKHTYRSEEEYKKLVNRLSRIEGQIRGIRRMLENNAYCTDILTQSAAVTSAMNAFSRELLNNHMHTCVLNKIQNGETEVIDELMDTIYKLMK